MSRIPDWDTAYAILQSYNREEFHLRHARIVAGVLGYFAQEFDPGRVAYWEAVGLLHDLDYELYPDQHCIRSQEILLGLSIDDSIIRAAASHCYGTTVDIQPEHVMEKILYATDELTGLIGAVAIMRPSRSVMDLEEKSVMKKFKTPSFAAGCSRDVILKGAGMLGWDLSDLISRTILAMRSLAEKEGL
jgi:predicted hydrolase (HD superfamily)